MNDLISRKELAKIVNNQYQFFVRFEEDITLTDGDEELARSISGAKTGIEFLARALGVEIEKEEKKNA